MTHADREFFALQQSLAGRYTLERELGRGGMGAVYLARDVALERLVAIKLLPPGLAEQPGLRGRFLREARTAAGFSHPNIVPIHLVEEAGDLVYYVMAYVDGETLGARVRRAGPLPPVEAARILREVAWALAYAHGRGVVHRDIKPDNIILERGSQRAMVMDFGIARVDDATAATAHGEILGSLPYMSPEQASPGEALDGRSDLYSLGVTAFYALTGRLPFEAATPYALIAMHMTEPAPAVTTSRPEVPAALADAVRRCLAKRPAERFASGEALAEVLGQVLGEARQIPVSVRRFVEAATVGVPMVGVGLLGLVNLLVAVHELPQEYVGGVLSSVAPVLVFLTLGAPVDMFVAARRMIQEGRTARDIVDAWSERVREYGPIVQPGGFSTFQRSVGGRVLLGVLGGFLILATVLAILGVVSEIGRPGSLRSVVFLLASGTMVGALGGAAVWSALHQGRDPPLLPRANPMDIRRAGAFVFGRVLGPLFLTLARWTVRGRPAAPALAAPHAPETALREAVETALSALPSAERRRLRSVTDAAMALEAAARSIRTRLAQLDGVRAAAQTGPVVVEAQRAQLAEELTAARARLDGRLQTAMTALENLRLDVLRLQAGLTSSGALTAAIEAAERIGREIEAEVRGREGVEGQ